MWLLCPLSAPRCACIVCECDSVLIVGNGGEKNTKTYEESAELNGYVISLQKLDELLKQEIASGSVVIEKANIVGADEKLFEL